MRETGVLEGVAHILEHQTTPYRQVRELGEEIPLTSRIIKVVNAYEDLNRGARGSRSRDAALERIYLGLGYEYDPRVVDALLRVLDVVPHHSDARRHLRRPSLPHPLSAFPPRATMAARATPVTRERPCRHDPGMVPPVRAPALLRHANEVFQP